MPRLGSGISLVGRASELRALRSAFTRSADGQATAALVSGDAGVGKTRLLTELCGFAEAKGALVLTGRCLDLRDDGLPYLPFTEALAPVLSAADPAIAAMVAARPALAKLMSHGELISPPEAGHSALSASEDGPRRPRTEQDVGQLQLFDAVLGLLTELGTKQPVMLLLEDVHWADGATRNLLSFLLSRLRGQRLLVLASYRDEDVHRRHPLRALLSELFRLPAVERVELRPLGETDARAFVAALAEDPVGSELIDAIAERSEGNPFFAEELLASSEDNVELPAGLAEVLLARLERLPEQTRRVLRAASVADGSVSHPALAEVTGLGELELDEALREAVHHHVLVINDRQYYAFRHALLAEAVYGDLLPGERSRLHAAYADRLRHQSAHVGQAARLAHHSLESNDLPTALAALPKAAGEAERLGAPGVALRHIEQALGIWDAVPAEQRPEGVDEVKLLHEASYFAATSGEAERAIAYARSSTKALTSDIKPERAAKAWRRLAESLLAQDGPLDEAVAAIGTAWDLVADREPSAARAWVLATRATILRADRRFDEARRSAEAAVANARTSGSGGAEADALTTLGTLADGEDRFDEARATLAEAAKIAQRAGALGAELRARYFLAMSHEDQGEIDEAVAFYRQGMARAEETGLGWSAFGLGVLTQYRNLRYVRGDWPADEEVEVPERSASNLVAATMAGSWAPVTVARGRFDEAERTLAGLRTHWRVDIRVAMAAGTVGISLAYWRGDYAEAVRRAQEAIGWLEQFDPWVLGGIRLGALGTQAAAAQAAEARLRGDEERAAEAVAAGEALLAHVRLCAKHGHPRSRTLGPEGRAWLVRAEASASGLKSAADPALWAEAVAAFGYGAVYDQALCRRFHAEALLADGAKADAELARSELRAAYEVADRLAARPLADAIRDLARRARIELPGAAGKPAPIVRDSVDPLTDRERAVLERVALGRTNRKVGEELYISEKTVSVHLSRAMAKLGANRRAEAVAIAYERGLLTQPSTSD